MADLKLSGTMPVVREVFMILVMTGTRAPRYCLVTCWDRVKITTF